MELSPILLWGLRTVFSEEWCWRGKQRPHVVKRIWPCFCGNWCPRGEWSLEPALDWGQEWPFLSLMSRIVSIDQLEGAMDISTASAGCFLVFLFVPGWLGVAALKVCGPGTLTEPKIFFEWFCETSIIFKITLRLNFCLCFYHFYTFTGVLWSFPETSISTDWMPRWTWESTYLLVWQTVKKFVNILLKKLYNVMKYIIYIDI